MDTDRLHIAPSALDYYTREVVSFQAQQARAQQRMARRAWIAAGGMFGLNVVLAITIVAMLPLKQSVPVFAYINEAGLLDTTTAISDLPKTTQVAGIESLLWQYVRHREMYAPSEAEDSYDIVSAMSDEDVRNQYQHWANPKYDPKAPAAVLKNQGFIRINLASGAWVSHTPDYSSGVYQIRFCKTTVPDANTSDMTQQRMIVALRYKLVNDVPLWQRTTFNHAGVIITEYPPPQQEGAIGATHPCAG